MILNIKLDQKGTEQMQSLSKQMLFSWKTSLIGLLSAVYAVAQPFINKDTTFSELFHDQFFILALIGAGIGFLSKDSTASGTPSQPITPVAAAQIAAVAATVAPATGFPVGPAYPNSTHIFTVLPGDLTPVGETIEVAGVKYRKLSANMFELQ